MFRVVSHGLSGSPHVPTFTTTTAREAIRHAKAVTARVPGSFVCVHAPATRPSEWHPGQTTYSSDEVHGCFKNGRRSEVSILDADMRGKVRALKAQHARAGQFHVRLHRLRYEVPVPARVRV